MSKGILGRRPNRQLFVGPFSNGRAGFQWRMLDVSDVIVLPKRLTRLRHFLCKWIRRDATVDVLL